MKFAVALLLLAVTVYSVAAQSLTDEQKKKEAAYVKACITETGTTADEVQKLQKGDYTSKDQKVKCFTKCVLQKSGFLNEKGEFQEKETIAKLSKSGDKEKVAALVAKCKSTKSTDPCENAYAMHECYKKAHVV